MEKRQYIKLTALQGSLIPEEESLTPEEKHEREVNRIISGEDEDDHGLMVFTYGDFKEYPLYIPIHTMGAIYGTEQGSIVETDSGNFLVKESASEIFDALYGAGAADLIVRDGGADNQ